MATLEAPSQLLSFNSRPIKTRTKRPEERYTYVTNRRITEDSL